MPTSLSLSIAYFVLSPLMHTGKVHFVFPYVWLLKYWMTPWKFISTASTNQGHKLFNVIQMFCYRRAHCRQVHSMDSMTFVIYVWNSERRLSPPGWSALFMLLDVNHGKNLCHVLPQHWQISTSWNVPQAVQRFTTFHPFFQFNRESTHYVAYKEVTDDLTKDD